MKILFGVFSLICVIVNVATDYTVASGAALVFALLAYLMEED